MNNKVIGVAISKRSGLPTVIYQGKQPQPRTSKGAAKAKARAVPVDEKGSLAMQHDQHHKSLAERPNSDVALNALARAKGDELVKRLA